MEGGRVGGEREGFAIESVVTGGRELDEGVGFEGQERGRVGELLKGDLIVVVSAYVGKCGSADEGVIGRVTVEVIELLVLVLKLVVVVMLLVLVLVLVLVVVVVVELGPVRVEGGMVRVVVQVG